MASYTKLALGSSGDLVKELQTKLNGSGYGLDVDGVFGNKTLAAVNDYQRKNNLAVDGVVGNETWGSLNSAAQKATGAVSGGTGAVGADNALRGVSAATGAKLAEYEGGYKPSAAVQAAEQYLQELQAQKPGVYESPYAQQLQQLYDSMVNREDFTYDLNSDPLYRQYRDQYMAQGQRAMMDTMGQAAGLTGGYGSTYAENAGQQAYQTYLQQLNDRVPELYQQALARYQAEGDELANRYALLNDRENTAYGRYRDEMGDYRDDLAAAYQRYQAERGFDYGQYGDDRSYWQNKAAQENSDYWTQTQYDYQRERDDVADQQWAKQYALQQAQEARLASAQGSKSEESKKKTSWGDGYSTESWKKIKDMLGRAVLVGNASQFEKMMDEYANGMSKQQWNEIAVMLSRTRTNNPLYNALKIYE